jgi:hypothetical protein
MMQRTIEVRDLPDRLGGVLHLNLPRAGTCDAGGI